MCGIAGILYFDNRIVNSSLPVAMNKAMAHRGPDADGIYQEGAIALCHRRLSIIDLSVAANQPFTDNSNRWVTVFNGEIYNYAEVKTKLSEYEFRTHGDTETLIAAYAKWGVDCLIYLKGMFAFAVWDKHTGELCLVRDRMGVKPLYYYLDDEKLIFASEVRTILATGLVAKKMNKQAVFEYLSYQSVGFPHSMIEGIQQLQAGSWMKIKNRQVKTEQYWLPWQNRGERTYGDFADVKKNVRDLLSTSIGQRLVSDVPVGAFLSGGIDSSVVVGLMAEVGGIRPSTFNISFSEKAFDESRYAEMVAKKFNADHHRIQLSPDAMLRDLQPALDAMDTPSGDGVNTFVVSKAIRDQGITVALSGVGGDELFAGYPIFKQFLRLQSLGKSWPLLKPFRRLGAGLLQHSSSNKRARIGQLLNLPDLEISSVYPLLRQLLPPNEIRLITGLPSFNNTTLAELLLQHSTQLNQLPLLSQVSAAEYMGYTQHTLLKDTDQMSMAVALEVREPFFDADLVEYVLGIPDKFKFPTYPKSLLVESVKPLLPDDIVFRKKQGFVFPWEHWMKNELRQFCQDKIHHLKARDFIHKDQLQKHWLRFLKGDPGIRWMDIWVFIVLEYWLEKNGVT